MSHQDGGGITYSIRIASQADAAIVGQQLCSTCNEHPRLGALSRCVACLKADAERDRQAREAVVAKALKAAATKAATKRCRTCKRVKRLSSFAPHRVARDGLRRDCKACVTAERGERQVRTAKELKVERARKANPHHRIVNRVAVRAWEQRNPEALTAKKKLKRAVRAGKIEKAPHCQADGCRRRRVQAHHHDYHRPLEVLWVCASHHRRGHAVGVIHVADGIPLKLGRVPRST